MAFSSVLITLLAVTSLTLAAPMSSGQVFSVKASSHRLTAEQAALINKKRVEANPSLRHIFESKEPEIHLQDDTTGQSTINLKDFYHFALIGNVTVGTPAQTFSVMFDLWSSDMSLVDVSATMDTEYCDSDSCSNENAAIASKNLYNASASTTSTTSTKKFRGSFEAGDKGTITQDTVNFGGVSLSMSFGDLTQVGSDLDALPIDGTVGVSPVKSTNKISNVLTQLVSTLTNPVMTIHLNRSVFIDNSAWSSSDAEIMFGSNALPQCNSANWATISLAAKPQVQLGNANATSVSFTNMSSVNGPCNNAVIQTGHPLMVVDYFSMLHVSEQAFEVIKKATAPTFNTKIGWYTVDCSTLDSIPTVSVGLSDGNSIVLSARDYVIDLSQTKYKVCILWASGDYDEGVVDNNGWPILLGQVWLNRHCISYDINANTLSYTDALPNNGQ